MTWNFLDNASQTGQRFLQFSDGIFSLHGFQVQFKALQRSEFLSNLDSLKLTQISLIDFPESPDWNLENLQKLALNRVNIPTPQSFKNFIEFLKTLEKLAELSLTIEKEATDQLTELFSLPNLTKFSDLEYLELSLRTMKSEVAIAELKRYLPGLRGLIKEVQVCLEIYVKKIDKF
jgi:hypothetical protein